MKPLDSSNERSRVLVVDDESATLDLCRRLLVDCYDIVLVESSKQALAAVKEQDFCVVLADQNLPDLDGVQLLTKLQEYAPNIARILITGSVSQEVAISAINQGKVHAYIAKPWEAQQFRTIVDNEAKLAKLRAEVEKEHQRYRRVVYDDAYDLPTCHLLAETAATWLESDGFLGLLIVDASEIWAMQSELLPAAFEVIRDGFIAVLKELCGAQLRVQDQLAVDEVRGFVFCVLLSEPRSEAIRCARDVRKVAVRLQDALLEHVWSLPNPRINRWPAVSVGDAFIIHKHHVPTTYQVREAISRARESAARRLDLDDRVSGRSVLERIIMEPSLKTVFQPIVELDTDRIYGYEALSRGPEGTPWNMPIHLMQLSERTGLAAELDRAFRTTALKNSAKLNGMGKIFVNILPTAFFEFDMRIDRLGKELDNLAIRADRLVFEISERNVVSNNQMLTRILNAYYEHGIQLAIDDVGVGYSSLSRIAALKPQFLKLDLSLVRNIDSVSESRSIVRALVAIAGDLNAKVIGEGIESDAEKECLLELGVALGQGYLLGRPMDRPSTTALEA